MRAGIIGLITISLIIIVSIIGCKSEAVAVPDPGPIIENTFFGEKLSGNSPQSFIPSVFGDTHCTPVSTPDGFRLYWSSHDVIHTMELIDGFRTAPVHLKLHPNSVSEDVPFLSADGNRLYFYAGFNDNITQSGIWYVDKVNNTWSAPVSIGDQINRKFGHWQFSVANNGTIYFPGRDAGTTIDYIMSSRLVNGIYTNPVRLFSSIYANCPYIAPDESFIIIASGYEADEYWKTRLYISYKLRNGSWSSLINLSSKMNYTTVGQLCPIVSRDGKFLFFMLNGAIKWLDSGVIQASKPQE